MRREGEDREGDDGRGRWGGGQQGGREKRGGKHIECLGGMRLQGFFLLCLPVQRRVPQLVYTNKTGDCLSIYLFICLAMDGQTARHNGLKFGG